MNTKEKKLLEDLAYLEQASAHSDEGPLGGPAARSILGIALRNTRDALEPYRNAALVRVEQIDKMYEEATGWGSWMVEASNERESLANRYGIPHKHLARSSTGGKVS